VLYRKPLPEASMRVPSIVTKICVDRDGQTKERKRECERRVRRKKKKHRKEMYLILTSIFTGHSSPHVT
tara:strand:- start:334 stop:540 length:207 start_codon:yes stop_codon:yes gene_type:complete